MLLMSQFLDVLSHWRATNFTLILLQCLNVQLLSGAAFTEDEKVSRSK